MYLFTKKGYYHEKNKELSGDIIRASDNGQTAVLVLADGVSTCRYGADGASIASAAALDYVQSQYAAFQFLADNWAFCMIKKIQRELMDVADRHHIFYMDYGTTLMVLFIDRERDILYYCNIGDGLLMAIEESKCPIISMPQGGGEGCPVVTTEGAENIVRSGKIELRNIKNILACTDGAWKMMYKQNIIFPEIRETLLNGKFDHFKELIRNSNNMDDCSFAIVNAGRAA